MDKPVEGCKLYSNNNSAFNYILSKSYNFQALNLHLSRYFDSVNMLSTKREQIMVDYCVIIGRQWRKLFSYNITQNIKEFHS